MGRRHRDLQQERRRAAGSAPPRRRPSRSGPSPWSGMSRYLVDLVGILVIAALLNVLLRELGMVNALLRIIVALVVGRIVVSLVRRALDSRT